MGNIVDKIKVNKSELLFGISAISLILYLIRENKEKQELR